MAESQSISTHPDMYDRILLPTDGSDTADLATERAIDAAVRYDATLHALYVVEHTREEPTQTGFEEHVAAERRDGKRVIADVERRATAHGVALESTIEDGVPRTTIEEYAGEHDIGLIVVGSLGASQVTEKLLGTVAKYVVNEAAADVLVVRPDDVLE